MQRPRVWDIAEQRDPSFTCANLFWWYAMYSSADYTVTPRPMYPADGRKLPDVWTNPPELRASSFSASSASSRCSNSGARPTSIESTRWIADAAVRVDLKFNPTLLL